jgi:hypothetical protein
MLNIIALIGGIILVLNGHWIIGLLLIILAI